MANDVFMQKTNVYTTLNWRDKWLHNRAKISNIAYSVTDYCYSKHTYDNADNPFIVGLKEICAYLWLRNLQKTYCYSRILTYIFIKGCLIRNENKLHYNIIFS